MSDGTSEPNEVELQHTADAAKEALASSLARLDDRVKHIRSSAVDATAASGWGIAAACAWWLSIALDRPRAAPTRARIVRPPLATVVLTNALKTASFVLTGVLVYASYRHVRRLGSENEAGQLPARQSGLGA
jgi:hypothetical protein